MQMTVGGVVASRVDEGDTIRIEIGEESGGVRAAPSPYWGNSACSRLSLRIVIERARLDLSSKSLDFDTVSLTALRDCRLELEAENASITADGHPTLYVTSLTVVVPGPPSSSDFAPVCVPVLPLSSNYSQPSGLLDDKGEQLCQAFLHNNKCKFRKHCCYSHEVPEVLHHLFLSKKRAETKRAKIEEKAQKLEAGPIPELPPWLVRHRTEAVFSYDPVEHPIGEAIARLLEVEGGVEALSSMHTLAELPSEPPNCPKVMHAVDSILGIMSIYGNN